MGETVSADPFEIIQAPADKCTLLRVSWLACQCREQCVALRSIGGWILPTMPLPWTPREARQLRRILHHVEQCRGYLQAHANAFPVLADDEARAWVADLARHHGSGAWPSWWAAGVVGIGKQIINQAQTAPEE